MVQAKYGLSFEDYAEVDACHKSALKHVKTAKHLNMFQAKGIDSDALRFGKIFHTALLEPDLMDDYEIYDEQNWIPKQEHPEKMSQNDQKKKWKEERELYYKNADEKEAIEKMVTAVHKNPLASKYLEGDIKTEPSLFWDDPKLKLKCKTRLDILRSDDIIVEVKTDVDPEPEAFGKKVYNMNYHVGAWFNREGFRNVFGRDIKGYVYIVVEKGEPHSVAVYMMSAHDFEKGEVDAYPAMKRYQLIKQGGLKDHNHGEDGEYNVMFLATPGWVVRELDYETEEEV